MKALACRDVPDAARLIALRPRFDACCAGCADAEKAAYLGRLFAFDPGVRIDASGRPAEELLPRMGIETADALVIPAGGPFPDGRSCGGAPARPDQPAVRFNLVYAHLPDKDCFVARRGRVSVTASATPLPGCDLYLYLNAYSYRGRQKGYDVLLLAEPIVVLPGQYNEDVWDRFDHVFTLYDTLVEADGRFTKVPMFRSGGWADAEDGVTEDLSARERLYPIEGRSKAIVMINGNKHSSVPGELYSKRIEAALWFFRNSDIPLDVYGNPPFYLPGYRGTVAPGMRFSVLARYRFNLCFENMGHPLFALGYVEKILDCLETRTVPIYYGSPNIEANVPKGCFIDFSDFDGFADLDRYLHSMTEDEYMGYVGRIDQWVCAGGLRPYSWHTLFDYLVHFYATRKGVSVSELAAWDEPWARQFTPQASDRLLPVIWTFEGLASRPSKFLPGAAGLGDGSAEAGTRALDLASRGKPLEALFELAMAPLDGSGDRHCFAARLMHAAGLDEAALVQLHTALSLNPESREAKDRLGSMLSAEKEHGETGVDRKKTDPLPAGEGRTGKTAGCPRPEDRIEGYGEFARYGQ